MIYFDHNSTTPILKEIQGEILSMKEPLNPSSIHSYGRLARKHLEEARQKLAEVLGIKLGRGYYKIIFTSGGTEANNLIINNFKDSPVLFSGQEHLSIIEPAKNLSKALKLKVCGDGIVDLDFLKDSLKNTSLGGKILISIMTANNETGVIQPIKEIIDIAKGYKAYVHSDAIQALGKMKLNISELDLDFASISAHKIGGLAGIGALVAKDHITISPDILGGGQERSERSGTENIIGAICLGLAAELANQNLPEFHNKTLILRNYIEEEVMKTNFGFIVAQNSLRLPNTLLIASNYLDSDTQLIQLDMAGIAVSSGSACSSGKVKHSHVLTAMGYNEEISKRVIRISLSQHNTIIEVKKFIVVWKQMHEKAINKN